MRSASFFPQSLVFTLLIGIIASISSLSMAQQFSENFNRSGSNPGTNWKPHGATSSDYWFLQSQKLNSGDGLNHDPGLTWLELTTSGSDSWQNYRANAEVEMQQQIGLVGLAFRWKDSNNYYYASIDVFRDPASGKSVKLAAIQKVSNGRTIDLATQEITGSSRIPDLQSGSRTKLGIIANGSNLRFLVNDSEVLSANDSDFPNGTIALGQSYNQVYFDNVQVSSSLGGSSSPSSSNNNSRTSSAPAYQVTLVENQKLNIASEAEKVLLDAGFINVQKEMGNDGLYTVFLGPFESQSEAEQANNQLASKSFFSISVRSYTPSGSSTARATPTPYPQATPKPQPNLDSELAEMERNAKNAESAGDLQVASSYWSQYIAKAPPGPKQKFGIQEKDRITALISAQMSQGGDQQASVQPAQEEEGGSGMLFGIIGGVVVVIVIIAAFIFLKKGKADKPVQKPVASTKSADKPKPSGPPTTKVTPMPVHKKAEEPTSPKPVTESARIKPGQVSIAPDEAGGSSGSVAITGVETDTGVDDQPVTRTPKPQLNTPKPAPNTGDKTDSGLSLDFLFDEEKSTEDKKHSSTEFVVPPQPDSDAKVPAGAGAALTSDNPDVFFTQDFSNEKEGELPSGWSGEYDYANLKVVKDDANAGGKCLRFEKTEGTGSALYTLNFPEASGRVIIEFDIRCDEKNKYLLGFYIEKDSNFRQSISTIVHRTNSKTNPTLRLQNESTPYEFGQWSHVKYDIDLPRHLVDGFVDDKPVVTTARLTSAPKVLNTMSIRDNLATTGTLMIRNIKVYRA